MSEKKLLSEEKANKLYYKIATVFTLMIGIGLINFYTMKISTNLVNNVIVFCTVFLVGCTLVLSTIGYKNKEMYNSKRMGVIYIALVLSSVSMLTIVGSLIASAIISSL